MKSFGLVTVMASEVDEGPGFALSRAQSITGRVDQLKTRFNVFWDGELQAGDVWRQVLADRLQQARCVLALWTRNPTDTSFVASEVECAQRRGVLVPVMLDGDPFAPMSRIGDVLTDEATDIANLLRSNQVRPAQDRIAAAQVPPMPLRRQLGTAISRLQRVEATWGSCRAPHADNRFIRRLHLPANDRGQRI